MLNFLRFFLNFLTNVLEQYSLRILWNCDFNMIGVIIRNFVWEFAQLVWRLQLNLIIYICIIFAVSTILWRAHLVSLKWLVCLIDSNRYQSLVLQQSNCSDILIITRRIYIHSNGQMSFAVIGAGVVGLSTALELQNRYPNSPVSVFAEKFGPNTTSDVAAGIFRPGTSFSGPDETITRFCNLSILNFILQFVCSCLFLNLYS